MGSTDKLVCNIVKDKAKKAWNWLKEKTSQILNCVKEQTIKVYNCLKELTSRIWDSASESLYQGWKWVKNNIIIKIKDFACKIFDCTTSFMYNRILKAILEFMKEAFDEKNSLVKFTIPKLDNYSALY